ncbi:MAG: replication initiator protein A [Rhodothalassiaceae bacterium]
MIFRNRCVNLRILVCKPTNWLASVGETTKQDRSPLLPERYVQQDFFVCDIFDATPKGDLASMEHPIFSLSTKPDHRIREYRNGNNFIRINPPTQGLGSVDKLDSQAS